MSITSKRETETIRRCIKELNPGKDPDKLSETFVKNRRRLCITVLILTLLITSLLFLLSLSETIISDDGTIVRSDYGAGSIDLPLIVENENFGKKEISLTISDRSHTDDEAEALFSNLKKRLPELVLGENESLNNITGDINLPSIDEETGIELSYMSSSYDILNDKGIVYNDDLMLPRDVTLTITMFLEGKEEKYDIDLCIHPRLRSESELFFTDVDRALKNEDEYSRTSERFTLPEKIDDHPVSFHEKRDYTFIIALILGVISTLAVNKGQLKDLEKECEKRRCTLLKQYPGFVSKLAVLTGAGMNISSAIKKIHSDEEKRGASPLTEELGIYVRNIKNGVLEDVALHDLGQRCGLSEYRRFTSILSTNAKKGSINLKKVLEEEAEEAFSDHQLRSRKLGEEAGTKLLLPMIMMLMVVMVIIMVPAFMTYQI